MAIVADAAFAPCADPATLTRAHLLFSCFLGLLLLYDTTLSPRPPLNGLKGRTPTHTHTQTPVSCEVDDGVAILCIPPVSLPVSFYTFFGTSQPRKSPNPPPPCFALRYPSLPRTPSPLYSSVLNDYGSCIDAHVVSEKRHSVYCFSRPPALPPTRKRTYSFLTPPPPFFLPPPPLCFSSIRSNFLHWSSSPSPTPPLRVGDTCYSHSALFLSFFFGGGGCFNR